MLKIKNTKERVLNLGTRKGRMLMFNPFEEKEVSQEVANLFEFEIGNYVEGGLLIVTGKAKSPKVVDEVADTSKTSVAKESTKKKTTKKKVAKNKVSKE